MLGRRDLEYLPHPRNTFLPLGSANATYNKLYRYVLYNISVPEALCVSTDSTNGYKWAIKWSTSALGTQAFELAILSKASLANHLCQPKCMATSGKIPDVFCGATMEGEGF